MFHSRVMRTDVTCVLFYKEHVIAGIGGFISIFEVSSGKLKKKLSIFYGQKVHGICPGEDKHIAVFGGRQFKVFHANFANDIQFILVSSLYAADWILYLHWLRDSSQLALVTANNVVSLWNWKTREKIETTYCEEKCILYSALLVGDTWEHLTVLGGTVFREVVIWAPVPLVVGDSPVLHRLRGHQGVIFSISFNSTTGHIYTTSDDRTVRVWKVEPNCPMVWANAEIVLKQKVFGHSARVWRCIGLDDIFISIGEDSHICIWEKDGTLLKRWTAHQGGSIWSIHWNEEADLMVTGGGDGGISLWPLRKWKDFPSRPVPLSFSEKEYIPRRITVLESGNVAATTDDGCVLHCLVQKMGNGTWCKVFQDARLINYCLLEVSRCRRFIALGTLKGHILIFQEKMTPKPDLSIIMDTAAVEGKIFSIHWLSTKVLLTCGELGNLELWLLKEDEGRPWHLQRTHQWQLPSCKERWLTSAILIDSYLLCGDRAGSIHVYSYSDSSLSKNSVEPIYSLLKLHGRLGVSSMECFGDRIFSTGRDGTLRQHKLCQEKQKLEPMCSLRLPMEWVASVSDSSFGLLVGGFVEMSFVLWSQNEQRILIEVPCGGGHRSWDYAVDTQGFSFAHIKDKLVHLVICKFEDLVQPVLQTGLHIRTINSVRLLRQISSANPMFVSAGEDSTVRVFTVLDTDLQVLTIQRSHICSVRALALCPLNDTLVLLISAGGQGQMKAWYLHTSALEAEDITCQEVATHMLNPSNYGQRKPWRLMETQMDSQTRYMSLYVVLTSSGDVIVIAGCSDGVLRLFSFNVDPPRLLLVGSFDFHSCCILLVSYIAQVQVVLSMSTDGSIAFWCLESIRNEESGEPFFVCQLHKSGINSHDLMLIHDNMILMATGGDDNAMVLTLFRVDIAPKKTSELLLQWRKDTAHSTQVTGLAFMGQFLVSTSIDQRVLVWQWHCDYRMGELHAFMVAEYCSTVADIQGMQAWYNGSGLNVCVYGQGMEIISGEMFNSELFKRVQFTCL